jgi:hypothetical protein
VKSVTGPISCKSNRKVFVSCKQKNSYTELKITENLFVTVNCRVTNLGQWINWYVFFASGESSIVL